MRSPKIRADHDILTTLAQTFEREANDTRQTLQRLQNQMEVLQGGDWIGKGAQAFYREMSGDVLPSMKRLGNALEAAHRATKAISQIMRDAEEEASRFLRGRDDGGRDEDIFGDVYDAMNAPSGAASSQDEDIFGGVYDALGGQSGAQGGTAGGGGAGADVGAMPPLETSTPSGGGGGGRRSSSGGGGSGSFTGSGTSGEGGPKFGESSSDSR